MLGEMNSRERVMTALAHRDTDIIPFSLGFGINMPAKAALMPVLGMRSMDELDSLLLGLSDLRWVQPAYRGPSDRNLSLPDGRETDIWGVGRKPVTYGAGAYSEIETYPLAGPAEVGDLEKYQWPGVDWFDFGTIPEKIRQVNSDGIHAIVMGNGNIFETAWYMRGFEQMLMDMLLEPEYAWELLSRATDFYMAYFTKALEAANGKIDIIFTADDIGQQEGMMFSPDLWEKMIKPHHVRLNKVLHDFNVKIMYHSDGSVIQAVPGLIDMGIDVLEALQFDAKGMDAALLKDKYGDRLCFHGGVSVQSTLPFGTPEQVAFEVAERIKVLGSNGGYILAPSHAIQAGTPPENIIAFLQGTGRFTLPYPRR
jgi:uroporphyrinogen decarboxylase